MRTRRAATGDGPSRAGRLTRARAGDPHTLVGAYVLDAVTDDDRIRFERHLAGCESCRAEVRGLREATARLAVAAEVRPRAGLREQTVQAAERITQLPPVTAGDEVSQPARRPALGRPALGRPAGWWPGQRVQAGVAAARGPRAWLPRAAVAVAVALVVVAVALGAAMQGAEHRLDVALVRTHAIAAVLGAPDARMMTAQVSTGGSATVVMSHQAGALVFTAAGLRSLSHARSYQLWLMTPAGPKSAGVLPAPRDGMTDPMVVSGLAPGEEVGLTVEPAGGSAQPTSSPVMMLVLGT